ncbi:MAG: ATP-dependent zinc metalloprotease FtsH [Puniceicoccales bacterium]|jgi:cell division protease FtsH|nr:ATP-dependent zinc metalloprotease FtsH [Puniceicoccales bacterium]
MKKKVNSSDKNNLQQKSFKPKSFLVWGIILLFLLLLNSLALTPEGRLNLTVSQVLTMARQHLIENGEIQSDATGGHQWYKMKGRLKNDVEKIYSILQDDATNIWAKQMRGQGTRNAVSLPLHFEATGRLTDARFNELLDGNLGFQFKERPASTLLSSILINVLPFLIILGVLYLLFMRQVRMAGKGAMGFGRSRARLLQEDKKKVTFKEVAGCDEAKEEVKEIVDFLKNPKKFQEIGGRVPKGCLMVGAPGTGKTLLAKAIAGEADVPFFSISGSDFVEMFVGVGASRVRDMFEQGKKSAPCLIFIDEIDAVGRQRGAGLGGGNDEREQTLNALLVEMDGFESREGIILMAATNRPDVLDSALLRPGRFDRQIVLDLPDIHGREQILQVHAKKIKLSPDVDLKVVARNTSGYSGADLENLLNEGALLAARQSKKVVEPIDLDEARDKISFGRERKKLMDDKDKRIAAYHEAGHAIVQGIIDDGLLPIHKVTIVPRGQSLGSTMMLPSKDILNYSKQQALNQICCSMGGRIAEELIFKEQTSGASADIRSATKLARKMVCDWGMSDMGPLAFGDNQDHIFLGREIAREQNYSEQTAQTIDATVAKIVRSQYDRAVEILTEKQGCLESLAQALLKYETLEGKYVYEILEHGVLVSEVVAHQVVKVESVPDISIVPALNPEGAV